MPKKIFLSYAFSDKNDVDLFKHDLVKHFNNGIEIVEQFEMEEGEHVWKTHVIRKIRDCSFFVSLFGHSTWESEAIKWEIEKAYELKKKIFIVKIKPTVFMIPNYITDKSIDVFEDYEAAFKCMINLIR